MADVNQTTTVRDQIAKQAEALVPDKDKNPKGQDPNYRIRALLQENKQLKANSHGKCTISLNNDSAEIRYSERSSSTGRTMYSKERIKVGEIASQLEPLLTPLLKVSMAVARGNNVQQRNIETIKDSEGRATKNPLLRDGKKVLRPCAADHFVAVCQLLEQDPQCLQALKILGQKLKELKDQDKIITRAEALANNPKERKEIFTQPSI